jgi:hypothetical protein
MHALKNQYILPGVYLAFSLLVWSGFVLGYEKAGAQALANVGLVVVVLPVAIIDVLINAAFVHGDVILNWSDLLHKIGLPQGYLLDNGYYYFPRVLIVTLGIFLWRRRKTRPNKSQ